MTSGPVGAVPTVVDVTIRYWASARAVAGCESERFPGRHVGDVLAAAAAAHTGLGAVLQVSAILMDGRPVTAAEPLPESFPEGTVLEVLPPFAGG
jgi:molybdopterin converting factor small subunit